MRKISILFVIPFFLVSFGKQSVGVDTIAENKAAAVGQVPSVEKKVIIDFAGEEIKKLGIADIRGFDVDSAGNIYLSVFKGERCIYKFDAEGAFVTSFISKGRAQGEMQTAGSLNIDDRDEVLVMDSATANNKLVVFEAAGRFLREAALPARTTRFFPLSDRNFLVSTGTGGGVSPFFYSVDVSLYDTDFKEIRNLDRLVIPNGPGASYWMPAGDRIYLSGEGRGYEIRVYDLSGNLIRKVGREYTPIPIPEETRESMKSLYARLKEQARLMEDHPVPQYWPPFSVFFIDPEGRLFVRTYDMDPEKKSAVHDIFDAEGFFVGSVTLDLHFSFVRPYARSKNGKIYGVSLGEQGFEQLAAYRLEW